MVIDTSATTRAITERMIKREQERISQEKDYAKESQKAILDALSFEAVLGASDEMQLKHLENVNMHQDKWADIYAESGGKLNMQQLAELKKDERKIQSELMNMKTNVKNFELVQKEILSDPGMEVYSEETHKRFKDAVAAKKTGTDFDWLSVLVPREPGFIEMMDKDYGKGLAELAKLTDKALSIESTKEGKVKILENNVRQVTERFEAYKHEPKFRKYMEREGITEDEARERFINRYSYKNILDQFNKDIYGWSQKQTSTLPEETQKAVSQYGWENVKPELTGNLMQINESLERVTLADKKAIEGLVNNYVPELSGSPDRINYEQPWKSGIIVQYGNDGILLTLKKGERRLTKELPYEYGDDHLRKNTKFNLFGDATTKVLSRGKQEIAGIADLVPAYYEIDAAVDPAYPTAMNKVFSAIDNLDEKAPDIVDAISNEEFGILPHADIVADGNKHVVFNGVSYQVKGWATDKKVLKENRNKLKAAIKEEIDAKREKIKLQQRMPDASAKASPEKKFTPEQEQAIEALLEKNPGWTREEIIQQLNL